MNLSVTDAGKARSALQLVAIAFFIEVGLGVVPSLALGLGNMFGSRFIDAWFTLQSAMWVPVAGLVVFAAWKLKEALEKSELTLGLVSLAGVSLLFDCYWLYQSLMRASDHASHTPTAISAISILVGICLTLGWCFVIGQLGKSTPYAAGVAVFAVLRTLVLASFRFMPSGQRHEWVYNVTTLISLVVSGGLAVLALQARSVVDASGAPSPSGVAAPVVEAGAGRLIGVGIALLVVGIGATAASYSVASSGSGGGRYLIATGAIAGGISSLIRGIRRLGS